MSELEKVIEDRVRIAFYREGVMAMKHRNEVCPHCGMRPKKTNGLGIGVSDLICIVPPLGRFLGIEMKRPTTKNAKRDKLQRIWQAIVRKYGGVAGPASSLEEAMALLEEARHAQ